MLDFADLLRRAWPVFREAIAMRRTLTYTELAGRVGPPLTHRFVHRQFLIPLGQRCREAGLPDLCALVVRKDTGKPGAGWHGPDGSGDPDRDWAEALAECFAFPWPSRPHPRLLAPTASS